MTKVTIDDKEYDTDNFNEEQKDLLNQLKNNNGVSANVQYQLHSLNVLRDLLTNKLKTSLAIEVVEDKNEV